MPKIWTPRLSQTQRVKLKSYFFTFFISISLKIRDVKYDIEGAKVQSLKCLGEGE